MSDLAPFLVAAAVRDQVVTDLQEEVSKLHQEKEQLQKMATHYKSMYERNHPFRTVSLVLVPPSAPAASVPQAPSVINREAGEGAADTAPSTLASCRVNLDQALSSGMVQVFEGHADATIPVEHLGRVELRIGDASSATASSSSAAAAACRLVDLDARSVMYFQCLASSHFFLRFLMEQGPDLMLDAGIGPLTHRDYCDFFQIQLSDMNVAGNGEEGLLECNMLDVRDRVSRPIDLRRLVAFFSRPDPSSSSSSHEPKYVKFMFDDNRMSSDFLFEYLDTPYDPSGFGDEDGNNDGGGGDDDDDDPMDEGMRG